MGKLHRDTRNIPVSRYKTLITTRNIKLGCLEFFDGIRPRRIPLRFPREDEAGLVIQNFSLKMRQAFP